MYWACLHDAEAEAKASETSEQCAPMFSLIDMESALFLHGVLAIAAAGPDRRRAGLTEKKMFGGLAMLLHA
ncbi:MAG: hypothetical protein ACRD08_23260 [Acidimicrobiales bacterium]